MSNLPYATGQVRVFKGAGQHQSIHNSGKVLHLQRGGHRLTPIHFKGNGNTFK